MYSQIMVIIYTIIVSILDEIIFCIRIVANIIWKQLTKCHTQIPANFEVLTIHVTKLEKMQHRPVKFGLRRATFLLHSPKV